MFVVPSDDDVRDDRLAAFRYRKFDVDMARFTIDRELIIRAHVVVSAAPVPIADVIEGVFAAKGRNGSPATTGSSWSASRREHRCA